MKKLLLIIILMLVGCTNTLSSSEDEFKKIDLCSNKYDEVNKVYKIEFPGKSSEELIKNTWIEKCDDKSCYVYNGYVSNNIAGDRKYYNGYVEVSFNNQECKDYYIVYLE